MKPYQVLPEMLWKPDPELESLRRDQRWLDFHREAGKRKLYFDRPVKSGRQYNTVAYTAEKNRHGGFTTYHLADGTGRGPVEATEAAYRASGRCDEGLDRLVDLMTGRVVEDDFEAIFD